MFLNDSQERDISYDGQNYTLLYRNTVRSFTWTTAYRLDKARHICLLHRVENSKTGEDSGNTLYLHYNDIKTIYLQLLQDELGDG